MSKTYIVEDDPISALLERIEDYCPGWTHGCPDLSEFDFTSLALLQALIEKRVPKGAQNFNSARSLEARGIVKIVDGTVQLTEKGRIITFVHDTSITDSLYEPNIKVRAAIASSRACKQIVTPMKIGHICDMDAETVEILLHMMIECGKVIFSRDAGFELTERGHETASQDFLEFMESHIKKVELWLNGFVHLDVSQDREETIKKKLKLINEAMDVIKKIVPKEMEIDQFDLISIAFYMNAAIRSAEDIDCLMHDAFCETNKPLAKLVMRKVNRMRIQSSLNHAKTALSACIESLESINNLMKIFSESRKGFSGHIIAQELLITGAVKLMKTPVQLASGDLAPAYINVRDLNGMVEQREVVIKELAKMIESFGPDAVLGVATGGIPWASYIGQKMGLPVGWVRDAKKKYGMGRQIEGLDVSGKKIVIIEDHTSTGESSISAAKACIDAGAEIIAIVSVSSRGAPSDRINFNAAGIEHVCGTDIATIAAMALNKEQILPEEYAEILRWIQDPKGWSKWASGE